MIKDRELIEKEIDERELVELAKDLVSIPSENPPGDEERVSKVLIKWLHKIGFDVKTYTPKEKRVNVIGVLRGKRKEGGKTLIWNGHTDVVPAGDLNLWTHPPFEPRIVAGKLYARGSVDMKGAIASVLEGIAAIQRAGIKLNGSFVLQAVADEEVMSHFGMEYLVNNGLVQGDAAIIGEPTGLKIEIAERGIVWPRITTHGVQAHASMPELGINAIEKMSRLVPKLQAMKFKALQHPLLGKPTINVGTIGGGTKVNIVPDRCIIDVDRRTIPGETSNDVLGEIRKITEELKKEDAELDVEIELVDYAEPSEISPNEEIVKISENAVELVCGKRPKLRGMPGATDARFLINQCNIPSVILGPGNTEQAHTANEFVEIGELVKASKIYALIAAEFLG